MLHFGCGMWNARAGRRGPSAADDRSQLTCTAKNLMYWSQIRFIFAAFGVFSLKVVKYESRDNIFVHIFKAFLVI